MRKNDFSARASENHSVYDEYRAGGSQRRARRGKKKRGINYSLIFIIFITFALVVVYMVQVLYSYANKPIIPTTSVQYGSVDAPVIYSGVIVRDEKVYTSPAAGAAMFLYNDLERIKPGATVCVIQEPDVAAQLAQNIAEIEKDILAMQERRQEISIFSEDAERINTQMMDAIAQYSVYYINHELHGIYSLKDILERNMALRNQMLLSENRGSLTDMISKKSSFQNELDKHIAAVNIAGGGILSRLVDGLESELTFENMDSLPPERTRMTVDYSALALRDEVSADTPIFKIVESNEWRLAFYVPLDQTHGWAEGDARAIYIQKDGLFETLLMTVEKIEARGDQNFVLLKSTRGMLDYVNMRGVKLKIADSEMKGPKIPNGAIVESTILSVPLAFVREGGDSGSAGLYVTRRNGDTPEAPATDENVSVRRQSSNDEYMYVFQDVNGLNLGDVILCDGQEFRVEEAQNIKGVFVVNNGYAMFRKIVLNENIPESLGYSILPPELNKDIKVYDEIVADARNIVDGQKLIGGRE
ncbi:MAG: hypothetical protein LBS62_01510 [Clostridiales bacterium]|jgi:hypothetical protein|nr:hypothetical protein [Clostridiales bacterium]